MSAPDTSATALRALAERWRAVRGDSPAMHYIDVDDLDATVDVLRALATEREASGTPATNAADDAALVEALHLVVCADFQQAAYLRSAADALLARLAALRTERDDARALLREARDTVEEAIASAEQHFEKERHIAVDRALLVRIDALLTTEDK